MFSEQQIFLVLAYDREDWLDRTDHVNRYWTNILGSAKCDHCSDLEQVVRTNLKSKQSGERNTIFKNPLKQDIYGKGKARLLHCG